MPYTDEKTGLEVVSLSECIRYIEAQEVARIAFVAAGRVQLYPINYAWDGESIVFRCEPGGSLASSVDGEVVFEIDETNMSERQGISVIARGVPTVVDPSDTPELAARLQRLALYPWVGGKKELWLRLIPAPLTGRRAKYRNPD
jgi:nitroimidazol reductase NimA-like FMN-containing flavoprotein (pyridoxamine 5'-phosphate oxidase superfamily)